MRKLISLTAALLPASAMAQSVPAPVPPGFTWAIELQTRPDIADARKWTPDDFKAVAQHYKQMKQLYEAGRLYFLGRSWDELSRVDKSVNMAEPSINIVVLKGSRSDAEAVLAADSAVKSGVMTGKVIPFIMFFNHAR